jgi:choline dehydrogenase-like flavoprotein
MPRAALAEWQSGVEPGKHHMGTTRMHEDPARGVVDRDGRVHGVDNLLIAGSSVFPSAGFANPTLTIVALSLRLAAHLCAQRADALH